MAVTNPQRPSYVAELLSGKTRIGDWLLDLLDESATVNRPLWVLPVPYRFTVGTAGDPCPRSLSLEALGHEVVWPSKLLRVFATGRAIEQSIIELLKVGGVLIEANGWCRAGNLPMRGKFDVLVRHPQTNEELLGEIKSINEDAYIKLPVPSRDPRANLAELIAAGQRRAVTQWTVYSVLKGGLRGFLLFEASTSHRRSVYWLDPDIELYETVMRVHEEAWRYARQLLTAPVTRDVNHDPVCGQCLRQYLCKQLPNGEVSYDEVRRVDAKLRGHVGRPGDSGVGEGPGGSATTTAAG